MGIRREGRELALDYIYQLDLGVEDLASVLPLLDRERRGSKRVREFARALIQGVWSHREEIDGLLRRHLLHWKLERLTRTDRGLLRLAAYEMVFDPDVPSKVAINEAVDIGKKYGGEESGKFLNGVLDAIYRASL
jgi:N utilization substance protein B